MLIIKRFSLVVLSFIRHSYREYESIQITKGTAGRLRRFVIIYKVVIIASTLPIVYYVAVDCKGIINIYRLINKHKYKA
ncbi:hypothetical protein BU23DRAFT_480001 [Bimuria novae-zelandiae CBS 107.79]|uniref:Uncharacterized protein n=1 Tax=Bimuria novae-zelandiae CBS 107.79 TaxID=1447943 RepID=A0A6A5V0B6_9PLEO|nr:hypothetical protein BU23DRAFT_480001 [Bimuria novae-zelandiae CBS 107.79]